MKNPPWIITPAELKSSMDQVVLLDVRELDEYAESRIDGCQHIPLGDIHTRAPLELKREDDIVIYCAHGVRSMQALMVLKMLGYQNLRSLEGGIEAWHESEK